ncbi:MAG TPA: methyltransferase domain-containing protein [Rhizomicrobium sp.]|jgi:SAM-dependent methyltransferase
MILPLLRKINRLRRDVQRALTGDSAPHWRPRLLLDSTIAVGKPGAARANYPDDLDKEEISRRYILRDMPLRFPGRRLRFLDVGGRDGELTYLLGNTAPLVFDSACHTRNKQHFDSHYDYFCVDLVPAGPHVLHGDICERTFLETYSDFAGSFDVVYSNNVFEHLARPWVAAEILLGLLKPGGLCVTIVPFAQRYHESPGDYFRYSHMGIPKLFEAAGPVRVLVAGYDTRARRYDWQGSGEASDLVAVDRYGAWRETWFSVSVIEKLGDD